MTSLWFVTPAHGRERLSALCFEQRAQVVRELAEHGVDARCVVVADDRNLLAAHEHGHVPLPRANGPLGWKRNEGIEYACRQGADYVVPIDSDDWCLSAWLRDLPDERHVKSGERLALMRPDGRRLTGLAVDASKGPVGFLPWVIPRRLLEPRGFRPCRDTSRFDDVTLAVALHRSWKASPFQRALVDELQVVDFKTGVGETTYELTVAQCPLAWHDDAPWARLAEKYPADLVDRAQKLYREAR